MKAKPKAGHIWWCVTCQRGTESANGHQHHNLYRIGPKAPLPDSQSPEGEYD